MECSKAIELLPEFVFDTLSAAKRAEVEQHLAAGCEGCQLELDEIKLAGSALAESLAPRSPRPELKQALIDRLSRETVSRARIEESASTTGKQRSYLPYVAASLAAIAAGSLVANLVQWPGSDVAQQSPRASNLQWQHNLEATERAFGAPQAQLASFARNAAREELKITIYHDLLAEQFHVLISNTNPPAQNQTLWLWLLDEEGSVLASGKLKYLGNERAAGILDLSGSPESVSDAVISSEPAGQHKQPSGQKIGRAQLERTS